MQEAKEEVRARLAIEDVIGEYVTLKRAGRLWRGLSPFTNEKTPSFFVTPEREIWHDFSSDRGGDIYAFIMEIEGMDFRQALEFLARKAGVDLSKYDTRVDKTLSERKARLLDANVRAVNFFQNSMIKDKAALDYITKKRGLSRETIIEWQIGYAPKNGGLVRFLRAKGFHESELRAAGLSSPRGGDMFRSRMMVPLSDNQGQIVGFTGRVIGDGEPKYLNTPSTILYDKGRQVFGLSHAKNAIRTNDFAVIVEGNLDVISSHQAGVKNVVACAGTALTLDHLRALGRLSKNVRLCFDSDRAGIAATERAIVLAEKLDLKLSVIEMPNGVKDPDELIKKQGREAWSRAIAKSKPAVQWVIDQYAARVDLSTGDGKKTLTSEAMKLVSTLRDAVEREHYMGILAQLTGASREILNQKLAQFGKKTDVRKPRRTVGVEKSRHVSRRDEQFLLNRILAVALTSPNLRSVLNNLPDVYLTEVLARVKYHLLGEASIEMTQDLADKLAELELISELELKDADDSRTLLLGYMRELEIIKIEARRASLAGEFASADENDQSRRKLVNGALGGVNRTLKTLRSTGAKDDFAGLFTVWDGRKDNDVV